MFSKSYVIEYVSKSISFITIAGSIAGSLSVLSFFDEKMVEPNQIPPATHATTSRTIKILC